MHMVRVARLVLLAAHLIAFVLGDISARDHTKTSSCAANVVPNTQAATALSRGMILSAFNDILGPGVNESYAYGGVRRVHWDASASGPSAILGARWQIFGHCRKHPSSRRARTARCTTIATMNKGFNHTHRKRSRRPILQPMWPHCLHPSPAQHPICAWSTI